jgi:hypothetical protein
MGEVPTGPVAYVAAAIVTVALVAFGIWARRMQKRIGSPPPDRPGHETNRFRFKYGAQPPGSDSPPF